MKFDENLRNLRREKDYSQEYLASVMNVSRQTISKWENGTAMPDLKRLTELADIFEVSMDTLLGIEYPSKDTISYDTENNQDNEAKAFDNIIAFIESDHKSVLNKMKKILTFAISLILIATITITSCIVSDIKFSMNRLEGQVAALTNNLPYNADSDNVIPTYTDWEFISICEDKPYIINSRFTYAPTTYAKNTVVYFLIPQKDGSYKRIDADPVKSEQGVFTADCELDVTIDNNFYTIVDDGENITKEEIFSDFSGIYLACVCDSYYITNAASSFVIRNDCVTLPIVYTDYGKDIKSARQIAKLNGKEIFNSEFHMRRAEAEAGSIDLDIQKEIPFEIPDSANNSAINELEFYYEFEMDRGYTIRYYPMIFDNSNQTLIFQFEEGIEHYEYIFNIDGEEVIIKE